MLLSKCPKFRVVISRGARQRFKLNEDEGNELLRRANISVKFTSDGRPLAVKRMKYNESKQGDAIKILCSVDRMTSALHNSAEGRNHAASISLRLNILQDIRLSDSKISKWLYNLMREVSLLDGDDVASNHVSSVQSCSRYASLEPVFPTPFDNPIDLESSLP